MMQIPLRSLILTMTMLAPAALPAYAQPPDWPLDQPFMPHRGRIGVRVQAMTPELREHFGAPADSGLLVASVEPNRPAAKAGVRVGDVIVLAGGKPVRHPIDLIKAVGRVPADEKLELSLVRGREQMTLSVQPEGEASPWLAPERWNDWIEKGIRRGSEGLRRQLENLERRLEELERKLEEREKEVEGGKQRT